jgi:hypothetical protein
MKHNGLAFGIFFLLLAGCATVHRDDPVEIYQKTQSYKNRSFAVVWSAALRSIEDVGFVVRKATRNVGLIHAEMIRNPDPLHLPPRLNVVIREEQGRVDVNFHVELPGQRDETGKRRAYADRFFKALKRNLRRGK